MQNGVAGSGGLQSLCVKPWPLTQRSRSMMLYMPVFSELLGRPVNAQG